MNRTKAYLALLFFLILGTLIGLRPKRQPQLPPVSPEALSSTALPVAPVVAPGPPLVKHFSATPRPSARPVPPPSPPRKIGTAFGTALPEPEVEALPTGEKSGSLRRLELLQPREGVVEPDPSGKMPAELPVTPVVEGAVEPQEMDVNLPQTVLMEGAVDPHQ